MTYILDLVRMQHMCPRVGYWADTCYYILSLICGMAREEYEKGRERIQLYAKGLNRVWTKLLYILPNLAGRSSAGAGVGAGAVGEESVSDLSEVR